MLGLAVLVAPAVAQSVTSPPGPDSVWLLPPPTSSSGPLVIPMALTVDGIPRRWTLVVPSSAPGGPIDLVVALHGVGHTGDEMRALGLEDFAVPAGVAVAYPDGAYGIWNDGRPGAEVLTPTGQPTDDIEFLRDLIAVSASQMQRRIAAVGVVGFSNGAMMAARVACEMSDVVSVVAIVAGSAGEGFQGQCRPDEAVSVAVIAARDDPVVPYRGGSVASFEGHARGRVSGVDATTSFWAAVDGCVVTRDTGVAASSPVVLGAAADTCASSRHVVRYAIDDTAHAWKRTAGFDTTAVVWSFVRQELPRLPSLLRVARGALGTTP